MILKLTDRDFSVFSTLTHSVYRCQIISQALNKYEILQW